MQRSSILFGLLILAALASGGCVLVIGDGGEKDTGWVVESDFDYEPRSRSGQSDAAEALLDDVRRRFESDDLLRHEDILIAARDGVVTLSGEASDVAAIGRALDNARQVAGVRSVVSRVVVVVEN